MAKWKKEKKDIEDKYRNDLWLIAFRIEVKKKLKRDNKDIRVSESCYPGFNVRLGSHEDLLQRFLKMEVIARQIDAVPQEQKEAIDDPDIENVKREFKNKMLEKDEEWLKIEDEKWVRIEPKKQNDIV